MPWWWFCYYSALFNFKGSVDFLEGRYHMLCLRYNQRYSLYADLHSLMFSGKIQLCFNGHNETQPSTTPLRKFYLLAKLLGFKNGLLFCPSGACHSDTTASRDRHSTLTCTRHRHNLPLWISFTAVTVTFPHHMLYGFCWNRPVAHAHSGLFILKTILHRVATWQTLDNSDRTHLLGVTDHNSLLLKCWWFCLENSFKSVDVKTNERFVIAGRISCNHIWQH